MRLFVGLEIDPEIRLRISTFMEGVRNFAPDVRWISSESLHITLKFIGWWPEERFAELERALASVRGEPTEIAFAGTGFFPTPRAARVFWIGIEAGRQLAELAAHVEAAVEPLGIAREQRPFAPHLTLARTGSGRPQRGKDDRGNAHFKRLQAKLAAMPPPDFGTMTPREFFLYESKLSPKGAQYNRLERFALAQS
ncbi:MAG TPA: RNA 2',3'-cyclic phosphodiesterase [Terriglobales bacterium]|jgi:2'-5' RNA ligase|nr:RNA 2',3'-cyclic phosphodiesterase [Terriglobales bacterium]